MPKNSIKKKGGSIASDRVNAFVPNFSSTPCKFKSVNCSNNQITDKFYLKNYGSFFKTQGGKKKTLKKGGNNQYDTFKKYDVPYKGIQSNSPLYNINYKNVPKNNNNILLGGKKSKKNKKQPGGASSPMVQRGDSNSITGAAIPQTWAQGIQNTWNGVTSVLTDSPSNPTYPSGLQLACNSNDCNISPDNVKYVNNNNNVPGFQGSNVDTIANSQGLTFPETKMEIIGSDLLPTPRAGGGYRKKSNKKKSNKNNSKKLQKKNVKSNTKKNKKLKKKNTQVGSSNGLGSDYQATLSSRGPYNYPNSTWHYSNEDGRQVAVNNFRAFNKSSPYIPPRTLSQGAALMPEPPQQLVRDPNYSNPWIVSENLSGYNDFRGVPTQNFSGAGKKKIRKNKNVI